MRLDQALEKIGVQVVKAVPGEGQLTIFLRVTQRPLASKRWNQTATTLVLASEKGKRSGQWGAEVAKVLYNQGGSVRFTWRVVFTGNIKTAQRIMGEAALEALRTGVEVMSMPLVGNRPPEINPAEGKLKGGHKMGTAEYLVAANMVPGVG